MHNKPANRFGELLPGNVAGQPQAQQCATVASATGAGAAAASVGEYRPENLSDPIHEHAQALGEIAPMRI